MSSTEDVQNKWSESNSFQTTLDFIHGQTGGQKCLGDECDKRTLWVQVRSPMDTISFDLADTLVIISSVKDLFDNVATKLRWISCRRPFREINMDPRTMDTEVNFPIDEQFHLRERTLRHHVDGWRSELLRCHSCTDAVACFQTLHLTLRWYTFDFRRCLFVSVVLTYKKNCTWQTDLCESNFSFCSVVLNARFSGRHDDDTPSPRVISDSARQSTRCRALPFRFTAQSSDHQSNKDVQVDLRLGLTSQELRTSWLSSALSVPVTT